MALVTYSDSEGDSDTETKPVEQPKAPRQAPSSSSKPAFKPLVDRGNPRKILVNLSEAKPSDGTDSGQDKEDGPARKRLRTGGGGIFSGFNDMLPAPKRSAQKPVDKSQAGVKKSKPFTLKTSAEPGFDRSERSDSFNISYDEFGKPSSGQDTAQTPSEEASRTPVPEPVFEKKGNAMMFKPLSVARNKPKRKTTAAAQPVSTPKVRAENPQSPVQPEARPETKPKVSLFGLSSGAENIPSTEIIAQNEPYESILYTASSGPSGAPDTEVPDDSIVATTAAYNNSPAPAASSGPQDLASVASDLNLSKSQMRQLLGRDLKGASSKVINFNTDEEYKSNSAYLANTSEAELAAQQHRPVRTVAPGKHSLHQLVNAVASQGDALEESFATGKRNKKEASAKYGW
ncbi:hypothetical protein H112_05983 [Trichophyton rubrum D6]|uniref:Uncharacterized protein n=3 Tax=Trichophyton TaxID=5550 RepID=F2SLG0_TRIRC|nr:uncharacterized protein TERG_03690 [Trichophyton rubrum CBS 118892]EZF14811.1 hypothetical protein H100_05997 [Trichophyton rubrum MR850]EZF39928.1 hypothetical protein H102_05966 [Trichophyton rubrum CBS 100081]EZF50568.1 hypothetical protein H103_05991 [Trichophyton rubrum CBS 288.86]EZF61112.1 hypothetical protein H104_05979 [Trichophyton rubrum CBS 289.86]EZF71745.1 hypothetical protein H105_06006 [Trichophyton soudanense CBS 452.61]EZF82328.1 hypothetical protein H110_05987 [Trichophy